MSLKNLNDYIKSHPVIRPLNRKSRTLIVVSDSKGSRLENVAGLSHPENEIIWKSKGGRNSFQAANFIEENLEFFIDRYGPILLAVWTGTCDLTQFIPQKHFISRPKRRRYIDLSNVTVSDIVSQYQRILSLASRYGSAVKVVFLECPQYSIKIWNKGQGHLDSESFSVNTEILLNRIENLNREIQRLNNASNITAPKFGLDLLKSRKSNKSYSSTKVSFSLLKDGIHPDVTLSKYWLRRIVLSLLITYCQI